MRQDAWLKSHRYLDAVARFCGELDAAAAAIVTTVAPLPDFEEYRSDHDEGVPLLQSSLAAIDLEPAGRATAALIARLAGAPLPEQLAAQLRQLDAELKREPAATSRIVSTLLGDAASAPSNPGIVRCVGWAATSRWLRPVLDAYARWRESAKWLRDGCPTCGSPPAMAQLIGEDPGKLRFLLCGGCGTRWRYGRTDCPFCEADAQRLAVLKIEGESGLRIDWCESCRGYLKTYDGAGEEPLLLADWTSLHLDVLARDRGLERRAGSLFEIGAGAAGA